MKTYILCAALMMSYAVHADYVIISNQSGMPVTVFLPTSSQHSERSEAPLFEAKVVKPETDLDPLPIDSMMGKLLFVTGPLVGTKAVKKNEAGIVIWDYNEEPQKFLSRSSDRSGNLHVIIDPVGNVTVHDGTLIVNTFVREEAAQNEFLKALDAKKFAEAAQWLIRGADINKKDSEGYTPLIRYIKKGPFGIDDTVDFLLSRHADVNAQDRYGNTPLYYCITNPAALRGALGDIIEALLKKGADAGIQNLNGQSARSFIVAPLPNQMHLNDRDKEYIILRFGRALGINS